MKKLSTERKSHAAMYAFVLFALTLSVDALAAISQSPLFLSNRADPHVMLTMSKEQQLFTKAYDDYSDLNGDGIPETSYTHSVDYFGYFDSYKCYTYDATNDRFAPASISATKYCAGQWSGNFLNWATMSRVDIIRKILYGGYRSTDTSSLTVLERSYLPTDSHSWAKYYNGADINQLTPYSSAITMCNTTMDDNNQRFSQSVTAPPQMRVASGDFGLWASGQTWQCYWNEEKAVSNSNVPADSGLAAAATNPVRGTDGLAELAVRVEACTSTALLGQEQCKRYPSGNYKPIGLLQEHGDDGYINFGLATGSYTYSTVGGSARKATSPFTDEVNVDTDGTFLTPGTGSIINTIDRLRIYGYDYNSGDYETNRASGGDNCREGNSIATSGECSNWGNPQSEIFVQAYRYFKGWGPWNSPSGTDLIPGLTSLGTWSNPLSTANYCAPLGVININMSSHSHELNASLSTYTNIIGAAEGVNGNDFFVGETSGNPDGLCTAKTVTNLDGVSGICPDAPGVGGNYDISGLAYYLRTVDQQILTGEQNVYTYGVEPVSHSPMIEIPVPGSSDKVVLFPACYNSTLGGTCSLIDFKVVTPHTESSGVGSGKLYVNWERSEHGGDYDQDLWGTIEYKISSTEIKIATDVISTDTTDEIGFGYAIGGVGSNNGFHAHSGINGFDYTDTTGATGCSNCSVVDTASSVTYTLGAGTARLLKSPLWYATKWGSFIEDEASANDLPDQTTEWDANGDGVPDKYFLARNSNSLSNALNNAFSSVESTKSSSASIVADSVTLETGTHIYQANFDSADWTGTIQSFPLTMTGDVGTADWSAQAMLDAKAASSRVILTNVPGTGGVAFEWANLSATQQALLNTDPVTTAADTYGDERVGYLRGEDTYELQQGQTPAFRDREHKLGDIVSSTPYFLGPPRFNYNDYFVDIADTTTYYSKFMADIATLNGVTGRIPMLYSGANDGMLHGFNARTGEELLAYVPSTVYANLPKLTNINYTHQYFVDGSPTAGDAYDAFAGCTDTNLTVEATPASPCWRSILVGGLNAGGKGIYALDVTNPDDFATTNAANIVLWEINSSTTGFSELGYTFAQPAIARMHDGNWAAIFSNGYGSTSGSAILYIVDLATGALIQALDTQATGANGLSTAAPVDVDGDRIVDYIYAGDLQGNLWKFDVTDTNSGQWDIAFKSGSTPDPLFVALDSSGVRQPITATPEISNHTTGTGYMIYFGTGKYFEDGDNNPTGAQVQTFYGIWDKNDGASDGKVRADLLQQTIDVEGAQTFGSYTYDVRVTSDNAIAWDDNDNSTAADHFGWYMDLVLKSGGTTPAGSPGVQVPGERVIHPAFLRNGRIIFTTLIPSQHACDYGGTGWLMELDSEDGSRLTISPFDMNHDGGFDSQEYITIPDGSGGTIAVPVSGKKSKVGIIQKPTVISAGDKEYKYSSGSKNAEIEMTTESSDATGKGRASWRQLR